MSKPRDTRGHRFFAMLAVCLFAMMGLADSALAILAYFILGWGAAAVFIWGGQAEPETKLDYTLPDKITDEAGREWR